MTVQQELFEKWIKNNDDSLLSIPEILDGWMLYLNRLIRKYGPKDANGNYPSITFNCRRLMKVNIIHNPIDNKDQIEISPIENTNLLMANELLWHSKMPFKIDSYVSFNDGYSYAFDLA